MAIKNSDAFLDEIISEIQSMKADPEKDTVARDGNVRYLADGVGLWLRGQNKK